jgi:peroxiredoxin
MSLGFDLSYAGLWALVIFQSLVLLGLLRESADNRRKLAGLPAGSPLASRLELGAEAPDFTSVEAHGGRTVRRADLAGRRSILLFLSPGCRNCETLAAAIHGIYHKAGGHLYLVCQGTREECIAFLAAHDTGMQLPLLLDPEQEMSVRFRVFGTPVAVLLDADLRIRSYGSPQQPEDLAAMVDKVAAAGAVDPASAVAGAAG